MRNLTYREIAEMLEKGGVEGADFEASLLIEKLFGASPLEIRLDRGKSYESEALREALERRISGEPLQYILGEWYFYGLTFEVNENCLCPRPDTETLVETAIKLLPRGARFLELCTGSGCIPVSVCNSRDDVCGVATDLFPKTLELAARNAENNRVGDRVSFVKADVFDIDFWICGEGSELVPEGGFDAILSNPPYIPTKDIENLSKEVKREPLAALDGGEDGLDFYREIVDKYGALLKKNGAMIFEIGFDQAEHLEGIAKSKGYSIEIIKDLGGNDRVAVIRS